MLILYLPGIYYLPILDRDEARFVQTSKQMLESNDWLTMRFQDEYRNKKPVGVYWVQAGLIKLLDADYTTHYLYRLPSLIGAFITCFTLFSCIKNLFNQQIAFITSLLTITYLGFAMEAQIAKADGLYLSCIVIAQLSLMKIYLTEAVSNRPSIFFWVAIALGILIKGPVIIVLSLFTIFTLSLIDSDRKWMRRLKPIIGSIIVSLIVLPWLIFISITTQGAFLKESLIHDFFNKLITIQEGHGAPPLSYIGLSFILLWPGSLFFYHIFFYVKNNSHEKPIKFLLAWIVPYWLIIELVPTKLPQYLLPIIPAVAILSAFSISRTNDIKIPLWIKCMWGSITIMISITFLYLPLYLEQEILYTSLVICLIGITSIILIFHNQTSTLLNTVIFSSLFIPVGCGTIIPQLNSLWISKNVKQNLQTQEIKSLEGYPIMAITHFKEPSLVFEMGTLLQYLPIEAVTQTNNRKEIVIIDNELEGQFQDLLSKNQIPFQKLGTVNGINYSNGQHISLELYRKFYVESL